MKCLVRNFVILCLLIDIMFSIKININNNKQSNEGGDKVEHHTDKTELVTCKICKEMFSFNFNYEDFMKSDKIGAIKSAFLPIYSNNRNELSIFTRESVEGISKNLSMEFFFKGTDSLDLAANLKLKDCDTKKTDNNECDKLRLGICEKILSYKLNTCTELNANIRKIFSSMTRHNSGSSAFNSQQPEPKPLEYSNISLLDMTPGFIQQNFDSTPKTNWQPPKPVLLDNFERNIGDQLKDISGLASELSLMENKLKVLKQQLSNKLLTAQTSYNAVQKTLKDISLLVSDPNMSSLMKSATGFSEDDWDQSAKPKLINS